MAVALVGASGWWLWHTGDSRAVVELLRRAHAPTLALAVLLLMASLLAKALRWRAFMPGPRTLGALEAVRIFHLSILVNNLLPFRLGDGVRVVSEPVGRVLTRRQALSVLVAERILDAVTLGLCAALALPLFTRAAGAGPALVRAPRFDRPDELGGLAAGALVLTGVGLVGGTWVVRRTGARWGRRVRWLRLFAGELLAVMRLDRRRAVTAGVLTALAWGGTFALHYALLLALGIEGSLVLAVVVTLTTNLSMLVPATPAGVGVTHAAAAAPLLTWGLPADLAVAYAVLVHAVNTVPPTLVGVALLALPATRGRPRATPPAPRRGARRSS